MNAVKQYPRLPVYNKKFLHTWLSSVGNFLLTVFKFTADCVTGSGYLCVSALYSCLMGIAKRGYLAGSRHMDEGPCQTEKQFQKIGLFILLAGAVYGVYMGWLIIFPKDAHYEFP